MKRQRRQGFTLIELLVVIAIIAILAAILFPVFAQAKTAAKKAQATSDIKQQALAILMYTNDSDDIMPPRARIGFGPANNGPDISDGMSWDLIIQPYTKNYNLIMSPMDPRQKYQSTKFGQIRRSYAVAGNALKGVQVNTRGRVPSFWLKGSYNVSTSTTWFPQPADTVLLGERRMTTATTGFTDASWALASWIENTRTNPQPKTCRRLTNNGTAQYGNVEDAFGGGSVWAFVDGHVSFKRVGPASSDTNCTGTLFPGYERRAGAWDANGEQNLDWTSGQSCLDANIAATGDRDCKVPGE